MNRLAAEGSPYLRQHADNPVDWYPWGDEAFEAARQADKPVLLSVGYSSCHWCHVMAHESFEDSATAELMNRWFVNVKVDREERPDVDSLYMEAVTSLTGHGGWPMTVFLTPEGEPFFAGTYFPPTARHGMPSFSDVLQRVNAAWGERRSDVRDQARRITAALDRASRLPGATGGVPDGREALANAAGALRRGYDAAWGGFGHAPKFPQAMTLEALLRHWRNSGDDDVLAMVVNSLDCMASGGIYDHLGGGFSRYATDQRWLVPHFEKMLYDNALLLGLYTSAWQVTGKPRYRQVADETVGYLLGDLRQPDGGFASAEDADSEGVEGKFYVWRLEEIRAVAAEAADAAVEWYGATEEGNFEGANILWRPVRGDLLRPPVVEEARRALLEARSQRIRPGLDDKVLTEWNGLAISALARAAAAAGRADWLAAAEDCGEFLIGELRRADGRWLRSWQAGDAERPAGARHLACAADYAAVLDAFIRLGEATGRARWIDEAHRTADGLLALFWDPARGGLLTCGHDAEQLVATPRDLFDNATPSASSAAAVGLMRLGALVGEGSYAERAAAILAQLGPLAGEHPSAFGNLLCALDLHAAGATEIVITGDRADLVAVVAGSWLPNAVLAWGEPYDSPLWAQRPDGAAYVCRGYTCATPADDAPALRRQLGIDPA
ncbi:MAG: thioredoxin domain-containing protein [Acidimicrobiia bacterium]|nr:thioredoxin domain-containing protein [Acidimicrobiia bacterium]MYE66984.1 thioredoxin domain-containing protein [Acidimicrobiia bacterium]MYJ14394.1 thioredoxin domain-containing protein [Acidimicrobiia bacterium]